MLGVRESRSTMNAAHHIVPPEPHSNRDRFARGWVLLPLWARIVLVLVAIAAVILIGIFTDVSPLR